MITVYGTPTCTRCMMVKARLNQHNIEFNYIDISNGNYELPNMNLPIIRTEDGEYHDGVEYTKSITA